MSELALQLIAQEKKEKTGRLDLGNCGLTELPEELFELTWLEVLILGKYYWSEEAPNILSKNKGKANKLNNNISAIKYLKNLTYLSCRSAKLKDITFIIHLEGLEVFDAINNEISSVNSLVSLQKLSVLLLMRNQISDINFLKSLQNLNHLNLNKNKITYINSFLKDLQKLTVLDLSNNQISDVRFLENLQKLTVLDLSYNQISDISFLQSLQKLTALDLSYNQISDIKPLLNLIKQGITASWNFSIKGITLEGNPLTSPPPEIVKAGNQAILDYFAELETQGEVPIYEAKLLIIGEGGSGKTSLARRLIDEKALMPKEKESTKGIDILHYDFRTKAGQDFRINIWDFGGQEIYHSTHQFFLTKRSLYFLLDDTRKDDKTVHDATFNYWLQVVELLSESSPVLIIQNEKADRSKTLDLKSMQGRFENIIGSWATNIQTCRGLDKVRDALELYVQQLPLVGELLPAQWVEIRRALEDLAKQKDYITLAEYFELCAQHQIPEEKRALRLSSYLHDLGSFLHFQEDLVLADLFILRNTWATDAVYKVLDNEQIKANYGNFKQSDLKTIWQEARYKSKIPQLLALMERFQLCYQLKDQTEPTWLAPQLLAIETPEYAWPTAGNLILRYRYEFMPKGLLSRFFVRMNRYVLQPEKAWRSGVFLERERTEAFVQETYGTGEIVIRVKGAHPKELMTLISEEFDTINEKYGEKLQVKKMIPCICSICEGAESPYFYEYDNLKRRKEKGRQYTECEISFEDVSVLGLLEGVFTKVIKTEQDREVSTTPLLKTIQLFLASSSELKEDRRAIEVWIGRENKQLIHKGIFLKLNLWEDSLDSMNPVHKQDDYNRLVLESDIFISLFASKVGKYSEEEFRLAFAQFLENGQPQYIYTYFKNQQVKMSDIKPADFESLTKFKEHLKALNHFPNEYETTEGLLLQLKKQLDKILT